MRSFIPTGFVKAAVLAAGCLLAACSTEHSQLPSSPEATALSFSRVGGLAVLNTQLGALQGTSATAWGHMQLKLYAIPTDPCGPAVSSAVSPGFAALALCGKIENWQNDDITTNAGLYFLPAGPSDVDAFLVAGLTVGIPVDPCRNISLRGGTQITQVLADAIVASPAQYQIRFGALGGQFGVPGNPVKVLAPDAPPIVPASANCDAIVTGVVSF